MTVNELIEELKRLQVQENGGEYEVVIVKNGKRRRLSHIVLTPYPEIHLISGSKLHD